MGMIHKHANNFCKVCCFLHLLLSLLSDISFWVQFCKRKIRKYPLKDLLYHKFHLSLFLHHLKLHSYMRTIPTRKMLMNVISWRLFILIYNLSNSTSHPVLNWQHLKSQVFCLLSHFPFLSPCGLSCSAPGWGGWSEWPHGLKEEMVLIHSFAFQRPLPDSSSLLPWKVILQLNNSWH